MGTESESFTQLVERIGTTTGGLSFAPMVLDKKGQKEPVALFMVKAKATAAKAADLLDLVSDVLLGAKLDDQARFKQMALEIKSSLESGADREGWKS